MMNDQPNCPKCSNQMWDNRTTKSNPRAPDFKCRNKNCDGAIWPPKGGQQAVQNAPQPTKYQQQDVGTLPGDAPFEDASELAYWNAMQFVVTRIVPIWETGKIMYDASAVNQATATVMIDKQRRQGR